ncbi:MAG: universal stress protein [Natronomonas sp.]|jgi:nucleotide-binding universal stress UspA family protein|uniref:universal stress protein n=1 Tax=Natronomonas sp. TaxID=2184060 RepID=UPI00286FBA8A|nr:universal stress protein [Natronomonas sp.]MDR9380380.1 universal stress protein [Natronomonas sp.]MDR9430186.1 universal stress protein [Natronomonas sp.]
MYTIVAGVDTDTGRARRVAEEITGLPIDDVHVILTHSFEKNPEGASIDQVGAARKARNLLESHGIEVSFEERSGNPATIVNAVADDADADLICVAGRERSPAGKAVFGSVTQDVILNTDRPVLVCGN